MSEQPAPGGGPGVRAQADDEALARLRNRLATLNGRLLDSDVLGADVTVCLIHRKFVPCRRDLPHQLSTHPADIAAVRKYQQGV